MNHCQEHNVQWPTTQYYKGCPQCCFEACKEKYAILENVAHTFVRLHNACNLGHEKMYDLRPDLKKEVDAALSALDDLKRRAT